MQKKTFFYYAILTFFLSVWILPLQGAEAFRGTGESELGDFLAMSPARGSRNGGVYVPIWPEKPVLDSTRPGASTPPSTRPQPINPDRGQPQPPANPAPDLDPVQPQPAPSKPDPVQTRPPSNPVPVRVRQPAGSNPARLQLPPAASGPTQPRPPAGSGSSQQPPAGDPAPGQPPFSAEPEMPTGLTSEEARAFALLNEFRAENGLPPLKSDPKLSEVARLKARDLVENNYFGHVSPTYGSIGQMLKNRGVSYNSAAENLSKAGNVSQAHLQLVYSTQGHRQIMLSPNHSHVGIGVLPLKNAPGVIVVQLFIEK